MQIGKYTLDDEQMKAATSKNKYTLLSAGAGSGKSLTILGRINYLIKEENIKEDEILCISFTNASSTSLKDKIRKELNKNIDVYTFHKLGLKILENKYDISNENTIEYIIDEMFSSIIKKKKNILFKYLSVENICEYLKKEKEINNLKSLIIKFIKLFKSSDYKLESFTMFHKQIKTLFNIRHYRKEKLFLIIVINVYLKYTNYLNDNNEIDFEDMIIKAKENVNNTSVINKYKHIIIDEFQDTSITRFNLIKAIIDKTDASLFVVGDDFQSIYRFTGCNLDLFLNFKDYFKDSNILKLENTYRNSNELIKTAGLFIMKNPLQIKKNLKSNKSVYKPIEIIYMKNIKEEFELLINNVYNTLGNNILVLGRNNNDIYKYLNDNFYVDNNKVIYRKNKDINITYLTIHKSKGLESENVIVLNNINNVFPSKIENERILRLVTKEKEYFPYEEERRLFYVALTRTKNKVFLVTEKNKESLFIKEIQKYL